MRAVVQDRYGSAEVLRLAIPRPTIADDQVLVRVHAAGLDRGTWHLMTGKPYAACGSSSACAGPKNPVSGLDVAGTVVAVGAAVTRFAVGDEVFGIGRGSFAEYAGGPARTSSPTSRRAQRSSRPRSCPSPAITALRAVTDVGRVRPGQRVLVIGASGGVGSYAVQLAKAFGAEVTGVRQHRQARPGAVARRRPRRRLHPRRTSPTAAQRYDVIIDIAGNPSLSRLRRALTPRASPSSSAARRRQPDRRHGPAAARPRAVAVRPPAAGQLVVPKERGSDIERLAAADRGRPGDPERRPDLPAGAAPEAMRHLEAGKVRGKVAITI